MCAVCCVLLCAVRCVLCAVRCALRGVRRTGALPLWVWVWVWVQVRRTYYAMCAETDWMLGQVMAAARATAV